jgi:hypothetical protein
MKKKVGKQNGRPMIKHFPMENYGKPWKHIGPIKKKHWKAMENYGKP